MRVSTWSGARRWLGVVVVLGVVVQPVVAKEKVLLVVMAGQSNMCSRILKADFQKKYGTMATWLESANNNMLYYDWKNEGWVKLKKAAVADEYDYGYQQYLGAKLHEQLREQGRSERIAILKYCEAATSLAEKWCPGGRQWPGVDNRYLSKGELYTGLMHHLQRGVELLEQQGYEVEPAGFIWYQGEGDGCDGCKGAAQYGLLLNDLINGGDMRAQDDPARGHVIGVKEQLGAPQLPVVVVRIHKGIYWTNQTKDSWLDEVAKVREALVDFAEAPANQPARWLDVDDLPLKDAFHFSSPVYLTIAERLAATYLPLVDDRVGVKRASLRTNGPTLWRSSAAAQWYTLRGEKVGTGARPAPGAASGCLIRVDGGGAAPVLSTPSVR